MENYFFQLSGVINTDLNNLSQHNGRRALIYLLGNNNNAIVAADILIYFIYQSFAAFKKFPDLMEEYNGFIIRTYQDIEFAVGCSNLMRNRTPLNLLKEEGLLETHNHSKNRRTCYRVNIENLIEKLDEAYLALGHYKEEYENNYKENHIQKEYKDPVDWDSVNDQLSKADHGVDYFNDRGISIFDVGMMFYVQKYWKETYGTDYKWSRGEFNTLSQHLTSNGVKQMMVEDVERLRDAIRTLDEVNWLTKAYTARKIVFRMRGYYRFKGKGENR